FRLARARTHPATPGTAADLPGLSLLGCAHDCAVDAPDHVHCFLPAGACVLYGKASDRRPRRPHSSFSDGIDGERCLVACQLRDPAALAPGVDPAAPRIPAFRAISGCARPAAGTRTLAMARPRCTRWDFGSFLVLSFPCWRSCPCDRAPKNFATLILPPTL